MNDNIFVGGLIPKKHILDNCTKSIVDDYLFATKSLYDIIKSGFINGETVFDGEVPLNNPKSSFVYYTAILQGLTEALQKGTITIPKKVSEDVLSLEQIFRMSKKPLDYYTEPIICDRHIIEDYLFVNESLQGIISLDGFGNHEVADRDYILPSVIDGEVPLNHPKCSLVYYTTILQGLTEALQTGKIIQHRKVMEDVRPPEYIINLFK